MEKILSSFLILYSFFLASCSAPATGSISHTRPSGSGGIQLPNSFQDIRWSDWRGYDENYDYSVFINTNGTLAWATIHVNSFQISTPYTSISLNNSIANIHDRSAQCSGTANGWINDDNNAQEVRHQLHPHLQGFLSFSHRAHRCVYSHRLPQG